jgi:cellobiose transport system substrate-binding protein
MAGDGFATMLCPSWMLGVIEGNAPSATGWDVADAFPNGGGNSGGAWLAVPTQSAHPEQAAELAAWLTAPEQQIYAFLESGASPSRVAAYEDPALKAATNPYFNDAPIGALFANRAEAIKVVSFKGPKYAEISTGLDAAIQRVEDGSQSAEDAWSQFERWHPGCSTTACGSRGPHSRPSRPPLPGPIEIDSCRCRPDRDVKR